MSMKGLKRDGENLDRAKKSGNCEQLYHWLVLKQELGADPGYRKVRWRAFLHLPGAGILPYVFQLPGFWEKIGGAHFVNN